MLQVPSVSTTALPSSLPAWSVTVTVEAGSPVPEMVGVLSLVEVPLTGSSMTGAAAVVSTVKVTGSEAGETLPAASVCVAVTVCSPSASSVGTPNVQVPSGPTVVVPTTTPSMVTSTVAPGSPVPVMVGVLSPVTSPSVGDVITGASGAAVSTTNVTGSDAGEVF